VLLLVVLTGAAACARGDGADVGAAPVVLAGSTSVLPFAERWAELYGGGKVTVQAGGSTAGIRAARDGTADIGMSSRALLRSINRMNDLVPGVRVSGQITVKGVEAYGAGMSTDVLRRHVGMVLQRPNPFPLSVLDNLAYGPRLDGRLSGGKARELAESLLTEVGLWDALRDGLDRSALRLSPEQQQRLCIARALATRPAVLLMDEPCSALDPEATARVEALMVRLATQHAVVVVTHNMQQAQRVASHCGFMLMGELVEFGATLQLFAAARDGRTADYVAGRFG